MVEQTNCLCMTLREGVEKPSERENTREGGIEEPRRRKGIEEEEEEGEGSEERGMTSGASTGQRTDPCGGQTLFSFFSGLFQPSLLLCFIFQPQAQTNTAPPPPISSHSDPVPSLSVITSHLPPVPLQ